jgi:hypothetical protein
MMSANSPDSPNSPNDLTALALITLIVLYQFACVPGGAGTVVMLATLTALCG